MDNVTNIIEAIKPTVDQMVTDYTTLCLKNGWPFTCRDRDDYRLDVMVDLLKVVGRYLLASDIIEVRRSTGNKHKVEASFRVKRDGEDFALYTFTTNVRGLSKTKSGEWRQEHGRYVVYTDLPKHDSNPAMAEVIRQRNRKKMYDRQTDAIQAAKDVLARDVEIISQRMAMSDDEIVKQSHLSTFTWAAMSAEGKANFVSEAAFNARIEEDKAEYVSSHRSRYNCARITAIMKREGKRIAKMEAKNL